ncbi:MAG: lipoyl(octanoyl) transferase LipB [Thermodesulfobacteriota bacterium]
MTELQVYQLGIVAYSEALEIQLQLLEKRKNDEIPDTLLLLEHPHTITTGKRGNIDNLLLTKKALEKHDIHFEIIGRGGDVTYHGPGQLVGYPIIDLKNYNCDVHLYLRNLEQTIIDTLDEISIVGRRIDGVTGVWVKRSKIASIGIGIKRWVTYHGFALNINTDMSYFDMMIPCGIQNVQMTSIEKLLQKNEEIDKKHVDQSIIDSFCKIYNKNSVEISNSIDI